MNESKYSVEMKFHACVLLINSEIDIEIIHDCCGIENNVVNMCMKIYFVKKNIHEF